MREIWNREELYAEVWEKPLVKIAVKYGISAVMLGKVCRKLLIPLPGRGYWAKKEFGKPVERLPLPEAKDLPVLYRSTDPPETTACENNSLRASGGEGGIRTPDRGVSPYNGLANRRLQPLGHLSAACNQQSTTCPSVHLLDCCGTLL